MNEVYLLSKFDVSSFSHDWTQIDFQTGHFATLGSSKFIVIFCLWASQNGPYLFSFTYLEQVSFLLILGKSLGCKKTPKLSLTKNSRTMHRIWHKSFSVIQSAEIKNWVPQLINRLWIINFSFLSVTGFSDLCKSKICVIRIKTQKLLHKRGNIF